MMVAKDAKALQNTFDKDTAILEQQVQTFVGTISPYLGVSGQSVMNHLDPDSIQTLEGMRFFRLASCTTEDVEDLAGYLHEKMDKLFTAIHSFEEPVAYGVVSYHGTTNLVIGIRSRQSQDMLETLIKGQMMGIGLETYLPYFSDQTTSASHGGILSAVPIIKVDDDKQNFDISTLMRSLNGEDYTVLFVAVPYSRKWVQDRYAAIVNVRDNCFAISKHNLANQVSETNSETNTDTLTKGTSTSNTLSVMAGGLLGPVMGGVSYGMTTTESFSKSISKAISKSIGQSATVSHDVQNGIALELMAYCDKAIERLKQGQHIGMWGTAIAYSAEKKITAEIIRACLCGEVARSCADVLPMQQFPLRIEAHKQIYIPFLEEDNPLLAPVTSAELGMICTPPFHAVPDFELKQGKVYPLIASPAKGVVIGKISDGNRPLANMEFSLSERDLNKHTFICGITGSGKTTTVKGILRNCDKPFMVIESAKKEYRNMDLSGDRALTVYTLGKPELNCLQFNPFYIQRGINLQAHIDFLKDLFNASFSFYGPMPYILEKCLQNIYRKKGWNLTLGYHPFLVNMENRARVFDSDYMSEQYALEAHKFLFPTMKDLKNEVKHYIKQEMQYDSEVGGNIQTAILARLESLCGGAKGFMFNTSKPIDMNRLMNTDVVFELEGIADDADKAFCVGLVIVFINEYRQIFKDEHPNEDFGLQHLLVIEEAHRLLKNVATERVSEVMGNPQGKAVEHFTNMIAEMRAYGQGVIIAEQIPSKLAPDVIKNSSNKIIQRVVSSDDQSLVANTIGMKSEDAIYLGSLETGVALCHKEGMNLPVYVKINPVRDIAVTDEAILTSREGAMFEEINYSLIRENTQEMMADLSLKLLNTAMAEKERVIEGIKLCRKKMRNVLSQKGVSLVFCRNRDELLGTILAENVMQFFINGVYSGHGLIRDDIYDAFVYLFTRNREEAAEKLQALLTDFYKQDCRNRCISIISELIKMKYNKQVDLRGTVKQYFLFEDEKLFSEIEKAVGKEEAYVS